MVKGFTVSYLRTHERSVPLNESIIFCNLRNETILHSHRGEGKYGSYSIREVFRERHVVTMTLNRKRC
jgi:hypothetical protein